MIHKFYKILKGPVSKVSAALYAPSYYEAPTMNYIAFIQNGTVYVGHSLTAVPRQFSIDRAISGGTDVSIVFRQEYILGPNRKILNRAIGDLQIFHITGGSLYYRNGIEGVPELIAEGVTSVATVSGWTDVLYQEFDQGVITFYSKTDGTICYKNKVGKNWSTENILATNFNGVTELNAMRTADYRIGVYVTSGASKQLILTDRANVVSATQNNDYIRTGIESVFNILSDKMPTTIRAQMLSRKSIRLEFDAEIIFGEAGLTGTMIQNPGEYTVRPFTSYQQISPKVIEFTTEMDIAWTGPTATLLIINGTLKTPAGTSIPQLETAIDYSQINVPPAVTGSVVDVTNVKEEVVTNG